MSTDAAHVPDEIDRENARLAAIGLAVWMAVTIVAVVLLWVFGPWITSLLV
ncbi:hypothetical protein [Halovivax limisalsi]|uniref:hypothetical protein n=1 Tax=Halovivax limisalsi TaxID=1453760 RepID=UPI001FFCDE32|nr:hypothetical protein [Halovivax limisalsi]